MVAAEFFSGVKSVKMPVFVVISRLFSLVPCKNSLGQCDIRHIAAKTAEDYSWLLETYLVPAFGNTPIGEVTYRSIQQWVIQTDFRAYHQVRQSLSILRLVYHFAQVGDLVTKSPVDLVKFPTAPRPVPDPLTPSDVQKIAVELPGRDCLMFLTLVFFWGGGCGFPS